MTAGLWIVPGESADRLARVFLASFPSGPWQANCYVAATAAGRDCVIVDPGVGAADGLRRLVSAHDLTPAGVLLTHGHIDHVASAAELADEYGVPAWIHVADRELLTDPAAGLGPEVAPLLAQLIGDQPLAEPADLRLFDEGVDVAGLSFEVIHAPGHRPGCVMLRTGLAGNDRADQVVFTGDVLFAGSIGRTDLPGGNHQQLLDSIRDKVFPLGDEVGFLCGHGPGGKIGDERRSNPFLRGL